MSAEGEVIHLSDLVADLKQRVEALERELASLRHVAIPVPPSQLQPATVIDLGALWDNASNQEKRWSEDDFHG